MLLLQRLLDEGILQDGELLALLARARPCHDLLGLLRAVAVPDHVGAAAQFALRWVQALVRFPVLKGSDPPLLGQGLLGGLPRAQLRLAVLMYAIDADGRWGILVGLVRVALELLSASAPVALRVRVRRLRDLVERCVLARPIQRSLVAPFGLLGARVGAGGRGEVDVRQRLARVGRREV